jgi:alanine racemase
MSLRSRTNTAIKRFEKPYAVHNRIDVFGSALRHNYDTYVQRVGIPAIPVLKSNAYGHGIEIVASALKRQKMPYIAVDGYFEALRIRSVSKQPVLVMGAIKPENFSNIKYDNFTFVVQHQATVHALGRTRKRIKIHVEINTGMNRYGVKNDDLVALVDVIKSYPNLELEGVMSHLADSDGDDPRTVEAAVRLFDRAVEILCSCGIEPRWRHIAQTAGSSVATSKYANAFRLGIGLYGVDPLLGNKARATKGLQPALRLVSTITNVIDLKPGDQVSYNYTFTAKQSMRLGVLPLGYYEGVSRALSNVGCVQYKGTYMPIVGRVCMNHAMIDLTHSEAGIDDEIIVYSNHPGDENTIDAIAQKHSIFNYNLLTSLSSDVRRVVVD